MSRFVQTFVCVCAHLFYTSTHTHTYPLTTPSVTVGTLEKAHWDQSWPIVALDTLAATLHFLCLWTREPFFGPVDGRMDLISLIWRPSEVNPSIPQRCYLSLTEQEIKHKVSLTA